MLSKCTANSSANDRHHPGKADASCQQTLRHRRCPHVCLDLRSGVGKGRGKLSLTESLHELTWALKEHSLLHGKGLRSTSTYLVGI